MTTSTEKTIAKAQAAARQITAEVTARRALIAAAKRPEIIDQIAHSMLGLETLETRGRDCLDFHDMSVVSIRRALTAAYEAGRKAK